MCSGLAWKGFFAWSHTAVVLCIEVHKRREEGRGGERIDVTRNAMWLLWKWSVLTCDQGCIHSTDSVEKCFANGSKQKQNGDKHTWICPIETLFCNCWTNDYTVDQLDAGKSVQGGIECVTVCLCVTVCHLKSFSRPVCSLMMGTGKIWLSCSSLNLSMLHWVGWMEYEWQSSNML